MATLSVAGFSTFTYSFAGGSLVFNTPFALGVLSPAHVQAYVVGELDGLGDQIYRACTYNTTSGTTTVVGPLPNPCDVVLHRTVPKDVLFLSFASGADVTRTNIDVAVKYTLMALHETLDGRWSNVAFDALTDAVNDAISARDVALSAMYAAQVSQAASEAWAQSPTAPDEFDPTSKSSKTLAGEAEAFRDQAAISAAQATLYDGPRFGTIALMQAGAGFADGKFVRVDRAFNGEQEGFVYDAASALTADGELIVDATGMGVGRLISTRTVYADFATLDADLRTMAAGTVLTVDGGGRCEVVASGQDYTLTSGRKIRLMDNEGIISSAILAAANGVTNDAAAWLALDVAAVRQASVPAVVAGTHLLDADVTLDAGVLGRGGIIKPGVGRTVTINGEVRGDLRQIFDASLGTIKMGLAQDVRPEWWGSGNTALRDAFKKSAAGSRILLQGKLYDSVAISVNNDPLAVDGADTGKLIQGVSTAQRYTMTGAFYGSRIKLANGQNANLFTVASGGANAWGSGGLRDVMLIGNQTNNTAGSGVEFANVKDWALHNVYAWDFKEDGLKFSGANNQISLTGYIELWNNAGRGLNGQAIGDPQWDAAIRCVNNTGYDCYIAEGNGRINQIYCYFGGGFRHDGLKPLHVNYLRVEDCDGIGADLKGYLIVDAAVISDNGVLGSTGSDMCGVYVRAGAKVHIKDLSSANRTASVHKQRHLLYSLDGECRIDHINDDAFGAWGVASEQTLLVTNNTALAGSVSVGTRRAISDTYANLKDVGASITPKPGTYDRYQVSAVTQSMTINSTPGNASCEGLEMAFQITSSGSYNINWGANYLDAAGAALAATALTVGQTARARFRQLGGKWRLATAISVV